MGVPEKHRLLLFLTLGVFFCGMGMAVAECTTEFTFKFGGEPYERLSGPRDVAIDASGNTWVADTSAVKKFNSSGEFVSQFGVQGGVNAIDLDAEGDVWVLTRSAFFPAVRQYKPNGELILSWTLASVGEAVGIAIDPGGNAWVANSSSNKIQKFNSKGELLLETGKQGTGNGEFNSPEAIAADSEGNVLVADTGNHRVQEFNSAGEFVRKYGSKGTGNGQLESPRGIAVDSEGKVWVSDNGNHRIQRFSSKGAYLSQFGAFGPNDGQFDSPRGIAVSGSNIWVADTGNDRVQKLSCL